MLKNIAHRLLSLIYKSGKVYTVPFGDPRGLKLIYDKSITYHTMMGIYEKSTFDALKILVAIAKTRTKDIVFADAGANVGLFSLWMSRIVGEGGHVVAFEPSPTALPLIKKNLQENPTARIKLVEAACAQEDSTVDFFVSPNHHTSSILSEHGGKDQSTRVEVRCVALDNIFISLGIPDPDVIKIDIEGGGVYALPGCKRLFEDKRSLVLVESHSHDEDRAIGRVIIDFDYVGYRLNDRRFVTQPSETHPHAEGVHGTLMLVPKEHKELLVDLL